MADPVYPSLEQQQQGGGEGAIGFEGLTTAGQGGSGRDAGGGSFSVQFVPSGGETDKKQLTDEPQQTYKTFEGGEQPIQASNEEIGLLERGPPSDKEKVRLCTWIP